MWKILIAEYIYSRKAKNDVHLTGDIESLSFDDALPSHINLQLENSSMVDLNCQTCQRQTPVSSFSLLKEKTSW